MAKLTKRQSEELTQILSYLQYADDFLSNDRVAIARKGKSATTTLHYHRDIDDSTLYEINKDIGSDLVCLKTGIKRLKDFFDTNSYIRSNGDDDEG